MAVNDDEENEIKMEEGNESDISDSDDEMLNEKKKNEGLIEANNKDKMQETMGYAKTPLWERIKRMGERLWKMKTIYGRFRHCITPLLVFLIFHLRVCDCVCVCPAFFLIIFYAILRDSMRLYVICVCFLLHFICL